MQFEHLCRTCMHEMSESAMMTAPELLQQGLDIFDTVAECGDLRIAQILSRTTPQLTVRTDDGLPQKICRNCLEQLLIVYKFQQMCLESDTHFRKLLQFAEMKIDAEQETLNPPTAVKPFAGFLRHNHYKTEKVFEMVQTNDLPLETEPHIKIELNEYECIQETFVGVSPQSEPYIKTELNEHECIQETVVGITPQTALLAKEANNVVKEKRLSMLPKQHKEKLNEGSETLRNDITYRGLQPQVGNIVYGVKTYTEEDNVRGHENQRIHAIGVSKEALSNEISKEESATRTRTFNQEQTQQYLAFDTDELLPSQNKAYVSASVLKKGKSSTERSRRWRERQRLLPKGPKPHTQHPAYESDEILPSQNNAYVNASFLKKGKSSTERSRRWRERQRLLYKGPKPPTQHLDFESDELLPSQNEPYVSSTERSKSSREMVKWLKPKPKTSAQRSRECRQRKKNQRLSVLPEQQQEQTNL